MKQIEVTTNVLQSLNQVDKELTSQGFQIVRRSRIEDCYMTQNLSGLSKDNILDVLGNSVLVRYLCVNDDYINKNITYKKKEYDGDKLLSEEKIIVDINDIDKAKHLLEALGFEKIVDVSYDVIVYKKGDIEFAFQDVENLGLLLEYESLKDYNDSSSSEILNEKKKMLEEIRSYNIEVSDDFDIKKAYQLILNRM